MIDQLKHVREWAAQRIGSQSEAPWDWYQLMKLREALDHLIGSSEAAAAIPKENLPLQRPSLHLINENEPGG